MAAWQVLPFQSASEPWRYKHTHAWGCYVMQTMWACGLTRLVPASGASLTAPQPQQWNHDSHTWSLTPIPSTRVLDGTSATSPQEGAAPSTPSSQHVHQHQHQQQQVATGVEVPKPRLSRDFVKMLLAKLQAAKGSHDPRPTKRSRRR